MKKGDRTIYYADLLHDDFAKTKIKTREIDSEFPFARKSVVWNGLAFLFYYIIAVPVDCFICKLVLGLRVENRAALSAVRHRGFFLFGNHTRAMDAFLPMFIAFPKRTYFVANPDAVSLPFLKNVVLMLGVIPIPTKFSAMHIFLETVFQRCQEGHCITVFPEAHIWPFYTGIRPFADTSFRYPVQENAPVVAMVSTYRKRKGLFRFFRKPGMTVTLSEPMYPRTDLSSRQAQAELRDRVYDFMVEVSATHENIAYIHYEPLPKPQD